MCTSTSTCTVWRETFEGENFRGLVKIQFSWRKLSRIAHLYCAKRCHTPHFCTFVNSHKTAKFAKVFFLKSFPLYGIQGKGTHGDVYFLTDYQTAFSPVQTLDPLWQSVPLWVHCLQVSSSLSLSDILPMVCCSWHLVLYQVQSVVNEGTEETAGVSGWHGVSPFVAFL